LHAFQDHINEPHGGSVFPICLKICS